MEMKENDSAHLLNGSNGTSDIAINGSSSAMQVDSADAAQIERFMETPMNCKLFVEKIEKKELESKDSAEKEPEFRKAEVLGQRTKNGERELYVHFVEFNKRNDEWVTLKQLDFSRGIEFPVPKKKADNSKKGQTRDDLQGASTPTTPSTPTQRGGRRPTPVAGQKRKKDDDSRATSVDAEGDFDDNKENNHILELGTEEEHGQTMVVNDEDDSTPSTFSKKSEIEKLRTSGSMTQCVSEVARVKNLNKIQMGKHEVESWYFSPYPVEYAYCDVLHICEFCLCYYASQKQLERHRGRCQLHHPPGNEIYRDENISFFEIDGRKQKTWCRNLCLLSKLFLDHKTLYYDVDPFLFYCMTERDELGYHLIGYFSKEKESSENYNVACILTLPQYQRLGYGSLLIAFSYLLSLAEQRTGSPEKPLSDLGLLSYRAYWTETIIGYLLSASDDVTIEDISQRTSITTQDILHTLQNIGALKYYRGQHIICLGDKVIEQWELNHEKKKKRKRMINPEKLNWTPPRFTQSQLRFM